MSAEQAAPSLGTDGAIRFDDLDHFVREMSGDLKRGRLWVRAPARLESGPDINVQFQVADLTLNVRATATVMMRSEGHVGLAFNKFATDVGPALERAISELQAGTRAQPKSMPPRAGPAIPLRTGSALEPSLPPDVGDLQFEIEEAATTSEDVRADNDLKIEPTEGLALPFVSSTGILRLRDSIELLGMYLHQLRRGYLVSWRGPAGEVKQRVAIRLIGAHEVILNGAIHSRIGEWVTTVFDDVSVVRDLLQKSNDAWARGLLDLGLSTAQESTQRLEVTPTPLPKKMIDPPPRVQAERLVTQHSNAVASINQNDLSSSQNLRAAIPPVLEGDVVNFGFRRDLRLEIEHNLKNGGLSVRSDALPIGQHRSLRSVVSGKDTGITIEADVVFAAGGIVGFSVRDFATLAKRYTGYLEDQDKRGEEKVPSPIATLPPDMKAFHATQTLPPDAVFSIPPPSTPSLSGELTRPLSNGRLIDFPTDRIQSAELLSKASGFEILEFFIRNHMTGVLLFERRDESQMIWMREGNIACVVSRPTREEDRLGRILVHHKKVSETSLREGLESAKANRRPLGATLIALGIVKGPIVLAALREQMRSQLERALEWPDGRWQWSAWREPSVGSDIVLANGSGILARYVRSRFELLTQQEIESIFGQALGRIIVAKPDFEKEAQNLGFTAKELRFVATRLDGARSLSEGVAGSPLGRLASLRIVALGLSMSALHFRDESAARHDRSRMRRPTAARGEEALQKSLEHHLHELKNANYFEVLGVHWSASPRSFQEARDKAKLEFDPKGEPLKDQPENIREIGQKIVRIIDDAFTVLSDPIKRIAYRKTLFNSTERAYSADMLVKQGEVLMMRGDRAGGIDAFERAHELSPDARTKDLLNLARSGS